MDREHADTQSFDDAERRGPSVPEIDPDTWLQGRTLNRLDRMADQWFKTQAEAVVDLRDCQHEPPCRVEIAHYEREQGIMLHHGPAAERREYNEASGGLMTDPELAAAARFEQTAAPERDHHKLQWRPAVTVKRRRPILASRPTRPREALRKRALYREARRRRQAA